MSAQIITLAPPHQSMPDDDMSQAFILQVSAPQLNRDRHLYRHASESAIVLGVEPGMAPFELLRLRNSRSTRTRSSVTSEAAGRKLEALQAYQKLTGTRLSPLTLRRGKYIAAMDGISEDRQLILDIQFLEDEGHDLREKMLAGVLPQHHKIRLQHMMMVSDAKNAHLWLYDEKYKYGDLVSVERCQGELARIFTAWDLFQDCKPTYATT